MRRGGKVAVIIPIDEFEEFLEDLHDLAVIAERRDEPTVFFFQRSRKVEMLWVSIKFYGKDRLRRVWR